MVTSSRGGNGIVFTKTTGLVKATGNKLWGNRARHLTDSGYDGGAFEVYGASDTELVSTTDAVANRRVDFVIVMRDGDS